MEKIKVGISSCLLGNKVRYDGGHKLDRYLTDTLGRYVDWIPVCPEVEYGLSIPREAMRLVGREGDCRLVTIRTGVDHTDGMRAWAERRLRDLETLGLAGFVFKSKSPSSGLRGVKIYGTQGVPARTGTGIFAKAFTEKFPLTPVEDDGRLHDPGLRENFVERLFVFHRWQGLVGAGRSLAGLVAFHTDHKLLMLSHSPQHYTELGRLVARGRELTPEQLYADYAFLLMEGLTRLATARKNSNVLQHIAGYFKRQLSSDEKQELLEVIEQYRLGLVPLIVPIVLAKHYVRKYGDPYLKRQWYLDPHPLELMLRNHV
ncbi:MAG TPA: DUF1722 domain-containing protein [Deltaproteobacteria bacterium]|nr:DUF1722 domain-containing protein [Deltaproteobacteria bacterium]